MPYSGKVYFFGQFRPLYVSGATIAEVAGKLRRAIRGTEPATRAELRLSVTQASRALGPLCELCAVDRSGRGVQVAARPHNPWLDTLTANDPPFPGLDYSVGVNP